MRRAATVEVGVGGDDHRALAAELERDRRQRGCGGGQDLAADLGATGEQHVVESLCQQRLGRLTVSLDDDHRLGVDVSRQQVGQQGRNRRRQLGRLDDGAVAGRDRADERAEREVERVVPRADDEHDAERLVLDPASRGKLVERQTSAPRTASTA